MKTKAKKKMKTVTNQEKKVTISIEYPEVGGR